MFSLPFSTCDTLHTLNLFRLAFVFLRGFISLRAFPSMYFFFLSVKCFHRNFGLTSGHSERPIKFALVIHFFIYFSGKKIVNNIYHILKKRTGSYFLKMLRSRHWEPCVLFKSHEGTFVHGEWWIYSAEYQRQASVSGTRLTGQGQGYGSFCYWASRDTAAGDETWAHLGLCRWPPEYRNHQP